MQVCLTLASWLVLTLPTARAVELVWKFKAGDELHYQMVQDTQMRMIAAGRTGKTTIAQTIDMTWRITAVDPSGVASMTQTIDRMRLKGLTPEGTLEADSQGNKLSPALAPSMGPVFKALIGAKFTLKMTPAGKISDVVVPETATQAVTSQSALAGMLNADSLKEMTSQSTIPLPEGPIEVGSTWSDDKKVAGANIAMHYTYRGPVKQEGKQLDRIETKADIKLDLPEMHGFKTELEQGDLRGEMLFDSAAGQLVASKIKQEIVLAISGQGQSIRQEIESLVDLKLVPPGANEKPAPSGSDNAKPE